MKIFPLVSALVIAVVLLAAAACKLIYPWEIILSIERMAAGFEVILAIALICFFQKRWIWLFSSQVFAALGGYSFFWLFQTVPCTCMGRVIELPKGVFLGIDVIFFITCLWMAHLLGASKQRIRFCLGSALVLAIGGLLFGNWVVSHYITPLFKTMF